MFQFLSGFLALQVKCAEYCLYLNKENKANKTVTSASTSETEKNCVINQEKPSDDDKMEVTVSDQIFKTKVKNNKKHTKNKIYEVKLNQIMGNKPGNKEEITLLNGCDKNISENLDCNSESDGSSIHEGDYVFDIIGVEKKPPHPDDILSGYKIIQIEDKAFVLHKEGSDIDQTRLKSLPENIIMDGLKKFVKKESNNLTNGETNEIDRNKINSNEEELSQVSGNTAVLDKSPKL